MTSHPDASNIQSGKCEANCDTEEIDCHEKYIGCRNLRVPSPDSCVRVDGDEAIKKSSKEMTPYVDYDEMSILVPKRILSSYWFRCES